MLASELPHFPALTAQESCSLGPTEALIQRASSWTKLVRVVASSKRQRPLNLPNGKMLTFEEIQAARNSLPARGSLLTENKSLHSRSQLVKLSPIICKDGLVQVCGRLENSQFPANVKYPILLPRSNRFTRMTLKLEHTSNHDQGVSALFVIPRQR